MKARKFFVFIIKNVIKSFPGLKRKPRIEDEDVNYLISDMKPEHDWTDGPRLSVIVNSLSKKRAFGGTSTLVEVPIRVFQSTLKARGWKIRFICQGYTPDQQDNIVEYYAKRCGVDISDISIVFYKEGFAPIPVCKGDVFIGSLWHSYYSTKSLRDFQANAFKNKQDSYVRFIQDYEANFYPWSSAYMMALAVYQDSNISSIFNSEELKMYFESCGHPDTDSLAFDPVMNTRLAEIMDTSHRALKEKRIIVYARPLDRRNCYFILKEALKIWSYEYSSAKDWVVIAVGSKDAELDLMEGVKWERLGKLDIEEYADQLSRASIGISLMASPHPSYPPLEMAYFGAITITNSFKCKDLSNWHTGIRSLDVLTPRSLALSMITACRDVETDSTIFQECEALKPAYLRGYKQETLSEIGDLICRSYVRSTES